VENFASDENRGVERREHERHVIPAAVTCTFFEEVLRGKGSFQGFIQDISLGGVAMEIRDDFLSIKESLLMYTTIEMTLALNLSDGVHRMNISGIIRWYKRIKRGDKSSILSGICGITCHCNRDDFVKSPSAALHCIFSRSTYLYVRLIPKDSRALHQDLFTVSSKG
jgi:hypothetical protein